MVVSLRLPLRQSHTSLLACGRSQGQTIGGVKPLTRDHGRPCRRGCMPPGPRAIGVDVAQQAGLAGHGLAGLVDVQSCLREHEGQPQTRQRSARGADPAGQVVCVRVRAGQQHAARDGIGPPREPTTASDDEGPVAGKAECAYASPPTGEGQGVGSGSAPGNDHASTGGVL